MKSSRKKNWASSIGCLSESDHLFPYTLQSKYTKGLIEPRSDYSGVAFDSLSH